MRRSLGQLLLTIALISPAVLFAGCAEMFTTSRKSNEEGMRLYSQKMYTDAAGAFRDAVRQEPRDYQSHFYLGVCYDEMRQHQQAFEQYRACLLIMNGDIVGKYDDAFRQTVLDTYASAVARYDDREVQLNGIEKLAHETNTPNSYFLLAKIYRLRGDADSAIVAYRAAANLNKWDFYIRRETGLYLLDPLNKRDEAAYYLQQAYRLNPNDLAVNTALTQLGIQPPPAYEAADPAVQPPVQAVAPTVHPQAATPVVQPRTTAPVAQFQPTVPASATGASSPYTIRDVSLPPGKPSTAALPRD